MKRGKGMTGLRGVKWKVRESGADGLSGLLLVPLDTWPLLGDASWPVIAVRSSWRRGNLVPSAMAVMAPLLRHQGVLRVLLMAKEWRERDREVADVIF